MSPPERGSQRPCVIRGGGLETEWQLFKSKSGASSGEDFSAISGMEEMPQSLDEKPCPMEQPSPEDGLCDWPEALAISEYGGSCR